MTRGALLAGLFLTAIPAAGQSWQTMTQSRQTAGEDHLRVRVEHVAGDLRIRPGSSGQLYRLALRYDEDLFTPLAQYTPTSASLQIGMEGNRHGTSHDWDNDHQSLDLTLAPDVPLDLAVRFGAAQATLDLGGLTIRSLNVETGASETHLTFDTPNPGACSRMDLSVGAAEFTAMHLGNARCSRITVEAGVGDLLLDFTGDIPEGFESSVSVQIGLGGVDIRVPDNAGVRLTVRRFLASVERSGFVRANDGSWVTPNWDNATRKISINVQAALGSIEILRVANGGS